MSDPLTQAEWKEIEGYLRERPQCSIDEGGAIWVKHSDQGLSCMHPRVFLDICREDDVYQLNVFPARTPPRGEQMTVAAIREFEKACAPLMSNEGLAILKKQLLGGRTEKAVLDQMSWIRQQFEESGPGRDLFDPSPYVSNYDECLMEMIQYTALHRILRGC
jgi:hypothetical protein